VFTGNSWWADCRPYHKPWTLEHLNYKHSILLGMSIDTSTATTYSSTLNLYLTFCKIHKLLVEPTPQTLSYYTTFQSFYINPKSVDSHLSGICNQLDPFPPDIHNNYVSLLVTCTIAGAKRHHSTATIWKLPLTVANLCFVSHNLAHQLTTTIYFLMLSWILVSQCCFILMNSLGQTKLPFMTTEKSHYDPHLNIVCESTLSDSQHTSGHSFWRK